MVSAWYPQSIRYVHSSVFEYSLTKSENPGNTADLNVNIYISFQMAGSFLNLWLHSNTVKVSFKETILAFQYNRLDFDSH